MTEKIEPALTPAEWQDARPIIGAGGIYFDATLYRCYTEKRLHPLAALCLYGQKFGFDRDDVKALGHLAKTDLYDDHANDGDGYCDSWCTGATRDALDRLPSILAKIAALLPSEARSEEPPVVPPSEVQK